MEIEIKLVPKTTAERAVLHLHEDNSRREEITAFLNGSARTGQTLCVTKEGKMMYLPCSAIYYIEAEDNTRLIYTAQDAYHTQNRLYELEKCLPRQFMRISKSVILNIHCVSLYKPLPNGLMMAQLKNDCAVYISRSYLKDLLRKLEL